MAQSKVKPDMRFSDEKLLEFQNEFREHVERCEQRFNAGDEQFKALIESQQRNTDAISSLIEETRDVVQLHRDLQGAARVGMGAQKFMAWCLKFGFIGAALAAIVGWIVHYLEKLTV